MNAIVDPAALIQLLLASPRFQVFAVFGFMLMFPLLLLACIYAREHWPRHH